MPTLTLMVGLPASGKSTYSKQLVDENTILLSSDTIRKELLGKETDQTQNELVFTTLYSRAREALLSDKNVIIDATNVSVRDRKRVLENFGDLSISRHAIVIQTPISECIKRDKQRARSVGAYVVRKYARFYQTPTKDEGFNKITFIQN